MSFSSITPSKGSSPIESTKSTKTGKSKSTKGSELAIVSNEKQLAKPEKSKASKGFSLFSTKKKTKELKETTPLALTSSAPKKSNTFENLKNSLENPKDRATLIRNLHAAFTEDPTILGKEEIVNAIKNNPDEWENLLLDALDNSGRLGLNSPQLRAAFQFGFVCLEHGIPVKDETIVKLNEKFKRNFEMRQILDLEKLGLLNMDYTNNAQIGKQYIVEHFLKTNPNEMVGLQDSMKNSSGTRREILKNEFEVKSYFQKEIEKASTPQEKAELYGQFRGIDSGINIFKYSKFAEILRSEKTLSTKTQTENMSEITTIVEAYAFFGLQKGASLDEVRAIYNPMVRKAHTDKGGTDETGELIGKAQKALEIIRAHLDKQ